MIAFETLTALVAGELDEAEADRVEEHLFGCDACSAEVAWLHALGDAVRALVRAGGIDLVATGAIVAQLERDGIEMRRYRIDAGGSVACSIADERYNLVELAADLTGVARVDLERIAADGARGRLDDLPFDPSAGGIAFAGAGDRVRALPTGPIRLRLFDGERLIGEYRLDHTAG